MWCAYAGDGIYRAETEDGSTLFGADEGAGNPWVGTNFVGIGQGDKAGVCLSCINQHTSELLPVAYRQREVDAACYEIRIRVARNVFLRAIAGNRATATQYQQRVDEVRLELQQAKERVRGYLDSAQAHGDDDYSYYYEGQAEGASYAVECWQEELARVIRQRRNAQRREARAIRRLLV